MIDAPKSSSNQASSQSVVWAIVALLFGGAVGYGAGNTHNADALNNLTQTVADYRAKLQNASPDEIGQKISAFENEITKLKADNQKLMTKMATAEKALKSENPTLAAQPVDPDVYSPSAAGTDAAATGAAAPTDAAAASNTIRPAPKNGRTFSMVQSKTFVDFMHIFAGKTVTVTSTASDEEATAYGEQMITKLQEAGLTVKNKLGTLSDQSNTASGVVVASKELRSAKAIVASLNIEGIKATADETALPARDENDLVMMIGSNPARSR